jgi:phosphoribosyl 1,2-cyclic phosphodiesterase
VPGAVDVCFWGVRGSTPCDGPQYSRYGGNTSCVELRSEGHPSILFDLGTGLRSLGDELSATGGCDDFVGHVLLSHLHWDHIQGLPFFAPLARGAGTMDVWGPAPEDVPLCDSFGGIMCPPYFPIRPEGLAGTVRFHDVGTDDFALNGAKVRSRWIRHTGPTLGFRVELEGVSIAYVPDHGPGCSPDDSDEFVPASVLELCDGADLLIHDAQHTTPEFAAKRNWGHCTVDYAVHVARQAGVGTLALFHHCPSHGDDDVDVILRDARDRAAHGNGPEVIAAADGLRVRLGDLDHDRPGVEAMQP